MGNYRQDKFVDEILEAGKRQHALTQEGRSILNQITETTGKEQLKILEARFDQLMVEVDELEERKVEARVAVRSLEGLDGIPGSESSSSVRFDANGEPHTTSGSIEGLDISDYQRSQPVWYDVDKKQEIRCVSGRTKFHVPKPDEPTYEGVSIGAMLRSLATGARTEDERRALSEGTDSAGGFTVPTPLAGQFIDLLRPKSHVLQAGAKLIELTSETLKVAKLVGDPAFSWRAEAAIIAESDPVFGQLTFTARSTACLFKASLELLQDSANADAMLQTALTQSAAQEIDRVSLLGSGTSNEPEGVINVTGINQVSMGTNGGSIIDYSQILSALQSLEDDDAGQPTAMVMAPRTKYTLAGLVATDNQPLNAPPVVAAIPMRASSKIPIVDTQGTAVDSSRIILGNFRELLIGMRSTLRVEVLKERYMDTLQVGFIAHLRFDIQLSHPVSFCEIIGITP